MSILKITPTQKILFFDIETASAHKNVKKENPAMFDLFRYKHRDRETEALLSEADTIALYDKTAALSPIYGKIVCISAGYINGAEFRMTSFVGEEKDILKSFIETVKSSKRVLCGYNTPFDVPYIRKRFIANGLPDYLNNLQGNDSFMKPWDLDKIIIDLMVAWKGVGYTTDSLEEVCFALGIDSPKDGDVTGSNVSKSFHSGKIEKIKEYCEKDVAATMKVYLKLKNY